MLKIYLERGIGLSKSLKKSKNQELRGHCEASFIRNAVTGDKSPHSKNAVH